MSTEFVRNIKVGERTKVDVRSDGKREVVTKTYHPEHSDIFSSEVRNLEIVRASAFQKAVDAEEQAPETRTLTFPFVDHPDCREAIKASRNPEAIIELVIRTIIEEMQTVGAESDFPFIPDGLRRRNDPRTYSKLLIDRTEGIRPRSEELRKIERLLHSTPERVVTGRYDPELTNFLYTGNDVVTIDYALMIRQEIGYPFAYAAIHLRQDHELHGATQEDHSEAFLEASRRLMREQTTHRPSTIENQVALACIEVLGYLGLEYQEYAKDRPEERSRFLEMADWAMKSIPEYLN